MNDNIVHTPKVSIIVAVYKVEAYIEQCARSLFEQTLEDMEFIFVDDATPDKSVDIIKRVLEDYPHRKGQVKIMRHEHNLDVSQTRKDGLDAATGEYFIYVDSDDWVEPNYAELLYTKAQETGADIVVCDFYFYKNEKVEVITALPDEEGDTGERLRDDTLNRFSWPNLWIRLFRRSLLVDNNITWPKYGMAEDVVITSQATYYANKLAYLRSPLYHYRWNPNSFSRLEDETKMMKRVKNYEENLAIVQNFLSHHDVDGVPRAAERFDPDVKGSFRPGLARLRVEYHQCLFHPPETPFFILPGGALSSLKSFFQILYRAVRSS